MRVWIPAFAGMSGKVVPINDPKHSRKAPLADETDFWFR
jgi:hypothetical protein